MHTLSNVTLDEASQILPASGLPLMPSPEAKAQNRGVGRICLWLDVADRTRQKIKRDFELYYSTPR